MPSDFATGRRPWRRAAAVLVTAALVSPLLGVAPAAAATVLTVTGTFPATTTVAQTGLAASVSVTNASTGSQASGTVTVTSLSLVPSCGGVAVGGACTSNDPGVFALGPTGTGAAGTACAGTSFTVSVASGDAATGRATIVPTSGQVVLTAPGGPAPTCRVNLTVSVRKVPTVDAAPATAGLQTLQVVAATGTHSDTTTGSATASPTSSTVSKATPTQTTQASASVPLGGAVTDTATLAGAVAPTGTTTFRLYGPDDATCATAAVFVSTVSVNGTGQSTSGSFTPTAAGTYRWRASYAGDANHNPVAAACNEANESVVVTKKVPTLTAQASADVPLGGTVTDSATLSGGTSPTGTITFTLFGPDNATCTGAGVFTSSRPVPANGGPVTSAAFTPTAAGTYRWRAAYGGDADDGAVATACGASGQSVVVGKRTPTVSVQASGPVGLGGTVSATSTVAGGTAPDGTMVFSLFGPDNATCTGSPVFTATRTVSGNGTQTSGTFTPTAMGTYRFVAAYSGDADNAAVSTACGANGSTVVVGQPSTTYSAVDPVRILDTRPGSGNVGAPAAKVGVGGFIDLRVTGVAGVPADALAVVLNVTAVTPSASSDIRVFPTPDSGTDFPGTSSLNVVPGRTAANLVIVKVGSGGNVRMRNGAGQVDLLADLAGWYRSGTGGSNYTASEPFRLLDTRPGAGNTGAPPGAIGGGQTIDLQVAGANGVPSGATAVVLNVTGVAAAGGTDIRVYPTPATGNSFPLTSNINLVRGDTRPNLVVVKVGAGGKVRLRSSVGSVHLLADLAGYYSPASTAGFTPLAGSRILDTRAGAQNIGARPGPVVGGEFIDLVVGGVGGVPADAGAVVLNVTGVSDGSGTDVRVYPAPSTGAGFPVVSNLNVPAGATVPNLVIVKVGAGGKVRLRSSFGAVQLVADVVGYYRG